MKILLLSILLVGISTSIGADIFKDNKIACNHEDSMGCNNLGSMYAKG